MPPHGDAVTHMRLLARAPEDAVLLEKIRASDELDARTGFSALFTAYWTPLCRWAYYFTRDRVASEEIVADVLADVWQRRATWEPRHGIEAYLFGAVRPRVRETARNDIRRATLTARFVTPGQSPAMSEAFEAPDVEVAAEEITRRLADALGQLPGRARAAVMYRWHEGLGYDEIARRLDTTPGAARVLVTRTLRTLRALLPEL